MLPSNLNMCNVKVELTNSHCKKMEVENLVTGNKKCSLKASWRCNNNFAILKQKSQDKNGFLEGHILL